MSVLYDCIAEVAVALLIVAPLADRACVTSVERLAIALAEHAIVHILRAFLRLLLAARPVRLAARATVPRKVAPGGNDNR